jgi:transposase
MSNGISFKSRTEQEVEARFGRTIAELLRDYYHGERRWSQARIAKEFQVDRGTVIEWMQKYDIPTGYNRDEAAL